MKRFDVGFNDPKGILVHIPGYGGVYAAGKTLPANGTTDFAPGCIFVLINGAINANLYVNNGTALSCLFQVLSGDIDAPVTLTAATSAATLAANPSGATFVLSLLAGFNVTLPAATGSGIIWNFVVGIINTTNQYKIIAPAGTIWGNILSMLNGTPFTANGYIATAMDTITLNGTTTGGANINDWVSLHDVGAGVWAVSGAVTNTGSPISPFTEV